MKMAATRRTFQRMKVLEYLKSTNSHPTAEEIFEAVKKDIPSITLATVYRNLNMLTREGTIQRLELDHEYRFDARIDCHQHFVCENSGRIYDLNDKKVERYLLSRLDKDKFDPRSVNIMIRGICKKPEEVT